MIQNVDPQQKLEEELKRIEEVGGVVTEQLRGLRDSTFDRFPIIFILLSTFGLVATLYGFEKVIDQIPVFKDNPWAVLAAGLGTLLLTGALYKKL